MDGRLDLERLETLDDDAARTELTQVKGVGRFTADGVLMLALRRQDVWPAADLALRRAVERIWELEAPARSRRSTPSASASGRGGRLPPPTSTEARRVDGSSRCAARRHEA